MTRLSDEPDCSLQTPGCGGVLLSKLVMVRLPEIERSSGLRLSRDKLNKLAHTVTDALAAQQGVEFIEDRNSVRLEVRRILEEVLKAEAKIDAAARQKIESQKRTILEGSQEWDILYRKYYNEEVKKLGI
jgi:hypothetical protein